MSETSFAAQPTRSPITGLEPSAPATARIDVFRNPPSTGIVSRTLTARRSAQQARQRMRLIVAAGETFVRLGYATSNVADILKAAGMSRRSFYEMFTSKEDILLALLDEMVNEICAEATLATSGIDDPLEAATLLLLSYVRVATRFPVVGHQVMAAGGEPRERRRLHLAQFTESLRKQLRLAQQRGQVTRVPDDVTLCMLVGGLDHLILSYHLDGARDRLPETEEAVRTLFARAVR